MRPKRIDFVRELASRIAIEHAKEVGPGKPGIFAPDQAIAIARVTADALGEESFEPEDKTLWGLLEARDQENEECAKIADEAYLDDGTLRDVAAKIRARRATWRGSL